MDRQSYIKIFFAMIIFGLAVSVALVIIYSGAYLINDLVPLTGLSKTIAQFIIVILAIYPVSFIFRGMLVKLFPKVYKDE